MLDEIDYESGMALARLTIREGARYAILEFDQETAEKWRRMMLEWASEHRERK